MHVKSEHRKALASVITAVFLVSFLFTSLGNLIPIASGASDSWWSDSFSYRKAITIDHTKVGGILENFPVLIDITDSNLAHSAQPDGDDIVFVDTSAGVKLNHEIEYYDSVSGHLVAWINIPLLTNSEDKKLHMYYGNQTMETQQTPMAVWDSSNRMVLHLDEKTVTHYDSTVNGNNGTPNNGVVQGIAGKIDGSDTFDGLNDYVQVAHSNTISGFTEALTASFWLRLDDVSRRQTILNKYNTGTNQKGWYIDYVPNRLYFFASQDGNTYKSWSASFLPTAGTWYYVTVVWQASTVPKFYVNGVQVTTTGDTTTLASIYNNVGVPLSIGRCPYDASRYLKGGLDEIRISNPVRSASYILTSYRNQQNPSTFYTLGSEESHTEAPTISNENPTNGATEANTNPTLSILATDSDLMTIIFQTNATGTWQEIQNYANAGSGTYACIPASMNKLGTLYHWSVSVTDGENWNNKTYSFTTTATILKNKWTKNAVSTHSGVVIADIDGNGLEEVIQAGEGRVTAIDGRDGTTRWTYNDSGIGFWAQPEMADLNKDGTLEVVVPLQYARGVLALHGNNGSLYWQIRYLGGTEALAGLVIGDIDGNGYPRIFVAVEDVELPYEGTLTALSYDGKILNQVSVWRPCGGGLSLADADNDGVGQELDNKMGATRYSVQ
jgi:hypothetical protein